MRQRTSGTLDTPRGFAYVLLPSLQCYHMNAKFVAKTNKDGQIQGLATDSAPALYFYHPDHLGSTAMVTNEDGHITQNMVYIPFGEVFVEKRNGSWTSPYLFNAKELATYLQDIDIYIEKRQQLLDSVYGAGSKE